MTITELLAEIHQTNPEDFYDRFEQAWEAIHGEPLPPSDAYDIRFPTQLSRDGVILTDIAPARYRAAINVEAYESAALILMWPFEEKTLGSYRWVMSNVGYDEGRYQGGCGATVFHPLSSGGGPRVSGFFETPAMAMLIAALKAHEAWGGE